jgi:single-strand DNA-binding protein
MAVDNNVSIAGNLVADPELRYTKGGAAISSLRVAVNRRWNKNGEWEEETSFFDVTAWAQIAENCAETLTKGMRVVVTGRLEEQRWEDKETQEPRRKIVIIADEVTPSLRWATAEVTKQHGKAGGGQKKAPVGGPVTEEEPF